MELRMPTRLRTGRTPMIAVVLAVLAGSTGAIFVRVTAAPSNVDAFYRLLFTTLLLVPVSLIGYRDDFRKITGRDLGVALVSGALLAVHFAAWMESLEWTSVAAAAVLVQTQVVLVAVGSIVVLDEVLSTGKVAGIAIAFVGVGVMSASGVIVGHQSLFTGPRPVYGNLLALLGAVGFAGYLLAGRSLRQRMPLLPYVTLVYGVSTLVLFVSVLGSPQPVSPLAYSTAELGLFLGMAVVPGIFGHTVMNWSLKYVESNVVSVTFLGAPLGNTILAVIILDEVPGIATVLGGVIVAVGIYQTTRERDDPVEQ